MQWPINKLIILLIFLFQNDFPSVNNSSKNNQWQELLTIKNQKLRKVFIFVLIISKQK